MRRVQIFVLSWLLILESIAFPVLARGQEETEDRECVPQCREGFVCHEGRCVSPCNPPCGSGEVCTRSGMCVPHDPQPVSTPGYAGSTGGFGSSANHSSGAGRTYGTQVRDYDRQVAPPNFDMAAARARRGVGAFFMVFGLIGVVTAIVIGGYSGASGASDALIVAMCIEAGSLLMFVPGLVSVVKNTKRIRKYEGSASLERDGFRLMGAGTFVTDGGGGFGIVAVF